MALHLLAEVTAATSALLASPPAHAAAAAPPPVIEVDKADQLTGWLLFAASETLTFFPRVRANGVIQLLLGIAIRAFPYEPPQRRSEPMTLSRFLRERGGRRRR